MLLNCFWETAIKRGHTGSLPADSMRWLLAQDVITDCYQLPLAQMGYTYLYLYIECHCVNVTNKRWLSESESFF